MALKNEERVASDLGEKFDLLKKYTNELEMRCDGLSLPQSAHTEKNAATPDRWPNARPDLTENQKTVDFNPMLGSDKIQGLEAELAFLRTELETSRAAHDSLKTATPHKSLSHPPISSPDSSSYLYQLETITLQKMTQSKMYETNIRSLSDSNRSLTSKIQSSCALLEASQREHQCLLKDYENLQIHSKTLETNLKEAQNIENY